MPTVIPVRMHFSTQDLWFNPKQTGAAAGDHVVVSTERGTEFGLATADPFDVPQAEVKGKELKPVLRVATEEDVARAEELAERGDEAMRTFRQLVKASGLDMKPVGVEFLFGGEKAVFYFAAEDRVDFRDLVRELASAFHQRVDMRQIGVRDEARLVGGYAPCGQELCCVRFGGDFEPVSIRMAKEQDLPLNSSKISGVCGRLMCCLRYEFEAYRDFKQRAPKKNALIDTPLGKAKIVEYNTPRETLTLRLENGKSFTVALADMTCSEGCCKRAADQHIPLRPDTVTREALEQLGTPDIIMQLADLDRANGEGAYTLDDSLLEGRRAPRRRSPGTGAGAGKRDATSGEVAEGEGEGSRRRRRGRDDRAQVPADERKHGPAGEERGARRTHRGSAPEGARTEQGARVEGEAGEEQGRQARSGAGRPRGGGMRPRRAPKGNAQGMPNAGDRQQAHAEREAGARQAQGVPGSSETPRQRPARGDIEGERGRQAGRAPEGGAQPTRHTRRHHNAAEAGSAGSMGAQGAPAGEASTRRGPGSLAGDGQEPRQGQDRQRTQRARRDGQQARDAQGTGAPGAPSEPNRARRTHKSVGPVPEQGGQDQPRPSRRRRPGDRGGSGNAGAGQDGAGEA